MSGQAACINSLPLFIHRPGSWLSNVVRRVDFWFYRYGSTVQIIESTEVLGLLESDKEWEVILMFGQPVCISFPPWFAFRMGHGPGSTVLPMHFWLLGACYLVVALRFLSLQSWLIQNYVDCWCGWDVGWAYCGYESILNYREPVLR